jgi:hypothetical protein
MFPHLLHLRLLVLEEFPHTLQLQFKDVRSPHKPNLRWLPAFRVLLVRSAPGANGITVWLSDQLLLSFPSQVVFSLGLTLPAIEIDPLDQNRPNLPNYTRHFTLILVFENGALHMETLQSYYLTCKHASCLRAAQ